MIPFLKKSDTKIDSITRRPKESVLFWSILGSGSLLVHFGLLAAVLTQSRSATPIDSTPIDWVLLPEEESAASIAAAATGIGETRRAPSVEKSAVSSQSNSISSLESGGPASRSTATTWLDLPDADPSSEPVVEDPAPVGQSQTSPIEPVVSAQANPSMQDRGSEASVQPAQPEQPAQLDQPDQPVNLPESSMDSPVPRDQPAGLRSEPPGSEQRGADHQASPEITPIEPIPVTPSPALITEAIEVPIPDVSGELPLSQDSTLSTQVTEQVTIPSQLTASLTATPLPPESSQVLDEVAQPTSEVQTFSARSATAPCPVAPEAVPFLGKTVAMQVITDEKGKVIRTITQESSQSFAYDQLATCLVKNWDFEPAIARGQPVTDDGLVVRITIDAAS